MLLKILSTVYIWSEIRILASDCPMYLGTKSPGSNNGTIMTLKKSLEPTYIVSNYKNGDLLGYTGVMN